MPRVVDEAIRLLEELGDELGRAGWNARLQAEPGRAPCLYVQNPETGARALAEHIYAAPREGGFWFWWSWAEPIAQDSAETAARIMRALRSGPLL
jgi:hypothetical protein